MDKKIINYRARNQRYISAATIAAATLISSHTILANGIEGDLKIDNRNQCFDVHAPHYRDKINGAKLQQWTCNGWVNQKWTMTGDQIKSKNGMCLDVHWDDYVQRKNGAKVQLWSCNGQDNQKWVVDNQKVRVKDTNLCLDVHGPDFESAKNGGKIHLWGCGSDSKKNQNWFGAIINGGNVDSDTPPVAPPTSTPSAPVATVPSQSTNLNDSAPTERPAEFLSSAGAKHLNSSVNSSLQHGLECKSTGSALACFVLHNDMLTSAELVEDVDSAGSKPCVENRNWGTTANRNQIWVTDNCHGLFAYSTRSGNPASIQGQQPENSPVPEDPVADEPAPMDEMDHDGMVEQPLPQFGVAINKYGQTLDPQTGFPVGNPHKSWGNARTWKSSNVVDTSPHHAGGKFPNGAYRDPVKNETGAFRVKCYYSHMDQIDPVVEPGNETSKHLHTFFGNSDVNPDSAPWNMRNGVGNITDENLTVPQNIGDVDSFPRSTCVGGTHNLSSYWTPTLMDSDRTAIAPEYAFIYYKAGFDLDINVSPDDLQRHNTSIHTQLPKVGTVTLDMDHVHAEANFQPQYTCTSRVNNGHKVTAGTLEGLRNLHVIERVNGQDVVVRDQSGTPIDICKSNTGTLTLDVQFYQCWNSNQDDNPKVIFEDTVNRACPTAGFVMIPAIQYRITYDLPENMNVDFSNLYLSSDKNNTRDGRSLHGDWLNGWDEKVGKKWLEHCVRDGMSCAHPIMNLNRPHNFNSLNHNVKHEFHPPHADWIRLGNDGDDWRNE